jgi:hypothetical protein
MRAHFRSASSQRFREDSPGYELSSSPSLTPLALSVCLHESWATSALRIPDDSAAHFMSYICSSSNATPPPHANQTRPKNSIQDQHEKKKETDIISQ